MTTDFETNLRRLLSELADAAPPPHEWTRVSSQADRPRAHRVASRLVAASVAVVAAAGLAVLIVIASNDGRAPTDEPMIPPIGTPSSSPTSSSTLPTTTTSPTSRPAPDWPGRLDVDVGSGVVMAPGFNKFVEDVAPSWAQDPRETARMLTEPTRKPERLEILEPVGNGDQTVVTVTVSNFMDDSVFAARYRFVLLVGEDGLHRFVEGRWSQRCQPGRGHQDFSHKPCV